MDSGKAQLKIRLFELERHYALAQTAVKIGWVPFILLGLFIISIAIAQIWDTEQNTMDDIGIVALFGLLMAGLIAFYAFVFRRVAKISAEITKTKIALEIDTGGDQKK